MCSWRFPLCTQWKCRAWIWPRLRPATVTHDGKTEDIKATLKPATVLGHKAWQTTYGIKKPGVYQFAVEPAPYFEPAEDKFIIHYTKTVVAAFGEEEGWDAPLGLKTEIVPLTRPFANYTGNVFRGRVLLDGKPVAGADVGSGVLQQGQGPHRPQRFLCHPGSKDR